MGKFIISLRQGDMSRFELCHIQALPLYGWIKLFHCVEPFYFGDF